MKLIATYRPLIADKTFTKRIQWLAVHVAQLVALIAARQAIRRQKGQRFQCLSLIAAYRPYGAAFGHDKPAPPVGVVSSSITQNTLVTV